LIPSTSLGGTEHPAGRLLYRGAEADLFRGSWEGLDAVFKVRKRLPYRLRELDDALRRQRTIHESEMIALAKGAGVSAPHLYFIDPASSTLVMEFIEGDRLKDAVPGMSPAELQTSFRLLGRDIARLHASGIMHGDLTTANIIRKGGRLVFLDFGLSVHSNRVEDHAVDLRLIKETLSGAHPKVAQAAMEHLLEGYREGVGAARAKQVQKQLLNIERRGRYARLG
jgi:TP53 regulating kinase-like protein